VPQKGRLDLVGVTEIAEMLGVSRQRVDQIVRSDGRFPKPVAELHAGRIWLRTDVAAWARRTGRVK
jgi:predicted DNA-binding transcriptional regulator AlpA